MTANCLLKKLGLGTVQWGLDYGLTNHKGQTSLDEVSLILAEARRNGVSLLDTAFLYGNAELVLGSNNLEGFDVVTKTPNFEKIPIHEKKSYLISTFMQSIRNLSLDSVEGLLVHNAEDVINSGGSEIVSGLKKLQSNGLVKKIGVSVYNEKQVDSIFKKFTPDIIQIPLNVFDQRLLRSGHLKKIKDLGVEVHVRSVFLQGLLLTPANQAHPYFSPIKDLLIKWHSTVAEQGLTPIQASLIYVRDLNEVDKVLVGTENVTQLRECIKDFSINQTFCADQLECKEPKYLNPSLWEL